MEENGKLSSESREESLDRYRAGMSVCMAAIECMIVITS